MKSDVRGCWLAACLILLQLGISSAETLESHFFKLEVPEEWTLTRNETGLWQCDRAQPFDMKATFSASRLKTPAEIFVQGTLELWKTQGETKASFDGQNLECLITPPDGSSAIFKSLRRQDDIILVSSFTFPVKHTDEALVTALSLSQSLEFKDPTFEMGDLQEVVTVALLQHQNSSEELADAGGIRREMTSFRQDWEPYFVDQKPALYQAFLAYLEARYDAAFVVAFGEEMGMPASLLDSRLGAVENRKNEVLTILQGTEETRWERNSRAFADSDF